MRRKVILPLLLLTMSLTSVGCEYSDTDAVIEIKDEIVDKAFDYANSISVDDVKQQYIDSGLKDAVDDLAATIQNSYETLDYIVDTTDMKELYSGEDEEDSLAVYMDTDGKVYLLNYISNKTTIFSGDAAEDFLNTYIEKATGMNLMIERQE
jgi:hypothetical protein